MKTDPQRFVDINKLIRVTSRAMNQPGEAVPVSPDECDSIERWAVDYANSKGFNVKLGNRLIPYRDEETKEATPP